MYESGREISQESFDNDPRWLGQKTAANRRIQLAKAGRLALTDAMVVRKLLARFLKIQYPAAKAPLKI